MADYAAAAEVDDAERERLVQRRRRVAEAADAGPVAERPVECLAERDAGVLDGVVLVDVEVAVDLQVEVHAGVERERVQHVVEEADAGRDGRATGAVDHEPRRDAGLARRARDRGAPAPEPVVLGRHRLRGRCVTVEQLRQRGDQAVGLGRRLHGRPDDALQQRLVAERAHHAAALAQPAERLVGVERHAEGHEHARLGQHLEAEGLDRAAQAAPLGHVGHGVGAHVVRVRESELGRHRRLQARSSRAAAARRARRRWPGRRARSRPAARRAPSPWRGCGRRSGSRARAIRSEKSSPPNSRYAWSTNHEPGHDRAQLALGPRASTSSPVGLLGRAQPHQPGTRVSRSSEPLVVEREPLAAAGSPRASAPAVALDDGVHLVRRLGRRSRGRRGSIASAPHISSSSSQPAPGTTCVQSKPV